jgi:hypothetical protein
MTLRSQKSHAYTQRRSTVRTASPIVGITLIGMLVALALVYLNGINMYVVSSFSFSKLEKQKVALESDVHELQTSIMKVSVGTNLEERAYALGLQEPSKLQFVHKDRMVAQAR